MAVSCGIGCRQGSDPMRLWCRLAAVALIQPLAWDLPYAMGTALKGKKKKKKKKKKKERKGRNKQTKEEEKVLEGHPTA